MLQFDEYKVKLNNLAPTLEELGKALDLESAERELDMLQAESAADGFWNNLEKAQKVQQRIKNLQDKVDKQNKRRREWDDLMALCEMGNEFEDESLLPELEEGFAQLAALFTMVGQIEKEHEERYRALAANLKEGKVFAREEQQVWVCRNCGYTHIGKSAPLKCPVCAHPQSYFELKAKNY